jgi:geranylgeranyl diphosphate synthase, type II
MSDFSQRIKKYREAVDIGLLKLLTRYKPVTMYGAAKYVLAGGGKRVRPLLTLFSCESVAGKWQKALPAALAVETLHNFTLVHDDIMDSSDSRRGRPTVHKRWDSNIAILSGDALVAIAYKSLLRTKSDRMTEITALFTDGLLEVCEGQSYDMEFEGESDVTLEDYLLMIEKKTGALLAMSSAIGGVIGNASQKQLRALRQFGKNLGLAFQIQDDLLDVRADVEKIGKPMFNDIKKGKRTFLLLYAVRQAGSKDRRILNKVFDRKATDTHSIRQVERVYRETGTIEYTRAAVGRYTRQAEADLAILPDAPGRRRLMHFARMLIDRAY